MLDNNNNQNSDINFKQDKDKQEIQVLEQEENKFTFKAPGAEDLARIQDTNHNALQVQEGAYAGINFQEAAVSQYIL